MHRHGDRASSAFQIHKSTRRKLPHTVFRLFTNVGAGEQRQGLERDPCGSALHGDGAEEQELHGDDAVLKQEESAADKHGGQAGTPCSFAPSHAAFVEYFCHVLCFVHARCKAANAAKFGMTGAHFFASVACSTRATQAHLTAATAALCSLLASRLQLLSTALQ